MKKFISLFVMAVLVNMATKSQQFHMEEIESEGSTITATYKSLKLSVPFRLGHGMTVIIPNFIGDLWDGDSKAAVEYACKIMAESVPTTCPIEVDFIRDGFYDVPYASTAVRTSWNYQLLPDHLMNSFAFLRSSSATIKRAGVYNKNNTWDSNDVIYTYSDGEIVFSPDDIFSTSLDGNVDSDKYDLVTVTLRELAKVLGMYTSLQRTGSTTLTPFQTGDIDENQSITTITPYMAAATRSVFESTEMSSIEGPMYNYATSGTAKITRYGISQDLHSPSVFSLSKSLMYFKEDTLNSETRLLQPDLLKGTAIHSIGQSFRNVLDMICWQDYSGEAVSIGGDVLSATQIVDTIPKDPTGSLTFNSNGTANSTYSASSGNMANSLNNINSNSGLKIDTIYYRPNNPVVASTFNSTNNNLSNNTLNTASGTLSDYGSYVDEGAYFNYTQEYGQWGNYKPHGWALYLLKKDGMLDKVAYNINTGPYSTFTVNLATLPVTDEHVRTSDGFLRARLNCNIWDYSSFDYNPNHMNYVKYLYIDWKPQTPAISVKQNYLRTSIIDDPNSYYRDIELTFKNMEGVTEAWLVQKQYDEDNFLISSASFYVDSLNEGRYIASVDKEIKSTFQLVTSNSHGTVVSNIIEVEPIWIYSFQAAAAPSITMTPTVSGNFLTVNFKDNNNLPITNTVSSIEIFGISNSSQLVQSAINSNSINISNLSSGIYTIKVIDSLSRLYTGKFIK
jgi:hypothetical protein